MGSKDYPTPPAQGRAQTSRPGPAGMFLHIELARAARNLASPLGIGSAQSGIGLLTEQGLVHHSLIKRKTKDRVEDLYLSCFLPFNIAYRNLHFLPYPALLMSNKLFLPPGTAPLIKRSWRSTSATTTSTFLTVTLASPICPAILLPLYTLPG